MRAGGFASHEYRVGVDVVFLRVFLEPCEGFIYVLYRFRVGVEGGVSVIQTHHEIARFRDARVESLPRFGQSAYPAAAVYIHKDGSFDLGIAVLAFVNVEVQSVVVRGVVHLAFDAYVHGTPRVEHGEQTEQLVFGVPRADVCEFDVVKEFLLKRLHVVERDLFLFHGHSAAAV